MTLYLTDALPADEIRRAKDAGVVAAKLYPAGRDDEQRCRRDRPEEDRGDARGDAARRDAAAGARRSHRSAGRCVRPRGGLHRHEDDSVAARLPELKVVFEHITTREAAQYVAEADRFTAATITAHHLLYNRNAIFQGGLRPHYYCLPVLKREVHRRALVAAATSGSAKFFLGTDSAPHAAALKEQSVCGAGCFKTALTALELYAEAFDAAGALDRLEAFASYQRAGVLWPAAQRRPGHAAARGVDGARIDTLRRGASQAVARRRTPGLEAHLMIEPQARIALLIDADNSPSSKIDVILAELAKIGVTNIRRAYGNWKKDGLKGLGGGAARICDPADPAVRLHQGQERDRHGARDRRDGPALHTTRPDAFGIVSSDSDFTPLVMHLKAKGAQVFGFGAQKTPMPFANACSRFLYLENLGRSVEGRHERQAGQDGCRSQAPRYGQGRRSGRSTGRGAVAAPGYGGPEAGRAARRPVAQRGRIGGRRRRLVGARIGRPADRQPGFVRPAQLRLPQTDRSGRSDTVVRSRPARHAGRAARQARCARYESGLTRGGRPARRQSTPERPTAATRAAVGVISCGAAGRVPGDAGVNYFLRSVRAFASRDQGLVLAGFLGGGLAVGAGRVRFGRGASAPFPASPAGVRPPSLRASLVAALRSARVVADLVVSFGTPSASPAGVRLALASALTSARLGDEACANAPWASRAAAAAGQNGQGIFHRHFRSPGQCEGSGICGPTHRVRRALVKSTCFGLRTQTFGSEASY